MLSAGLDVLETAAAAWLGVHSKGKKFRLRRKWLDGIFEDAHLLRTSVVKLVPR